MERPEAVVMNMFYTGLGIARSLGEQGVHVIGLTSQHRIYGNFSRYAKTVFAPDSRQEPEALAAFLTGMGERDGRRRVIFPTRDDDAVFLDRFREQLEPYFALAVPSRPVLAACLSKWETYQWATRAGVATPKCWLIEGPDDVERILPELTYPCVLKPVAAHHWRKSRNWEIVGGRKAIAISSAQELLREYQAVGGADPRALLQELIPGGDSNLVIQACYMDRDSNWSAGFNTRKLLQAPEGFGTGCIVQGTYCPELIAPTLKLLQAMRYTGIAEVEYKQDSQTGEYKLIEVNPRPWDQHRLGYACGVDLIYVAYCELAGEPVPVVKAGATGHKFIAEDTFVTAALRSLWKRDGRFRPMLQLARGRRIYGIWWTRDPLPFLAYFGTRYIPSLVLSGLRFLASSMRSQLGRREVDPPIQPYQDRLGKENGHG